MSAESHIIIIDVHISVMNGNINNQKTITDEGRQNRKSLHRSMTCIQYYPITNFPQLPFELYSEMSSKAEIKGENTGWPRFL